MAMYFFVRRVCKFGLPMTRAIKMIEQVKIVNNKRMWVLDLVEKKLFNKLLDIDQNYALENMIAE